MLYLFKNIIIEEYFVIDYFIKWDHIMLSHVHVTTKKDTFNNLCQILPLQIEGASSCHKNSKNPLKHSCDNYVTKVRREG